jgi:hypothetical protein
VKNRRRRVANIVVIAAALALAVWGVWYREHVGRSAVASLAGVVGLVGFMLFQALYDTQTEIAWAALHARIDLLEARLAKCEARDDDGGLP